jgi:HSP20 family protein
MGRREYWEPAGRVSRQEALDSLFDRTWSGPSFGWQRGARSALLPVDVYSTPDEIVIKASVPGLDPEDVEITIEGEMLAIKGERRAPLENVDYSIQERRFGPFGRTLTLNVPVLADEAEAVFDRGVLTLSIPKAEKARPRVIQVRSR